MISQAWKAEIAIRECRFLRACWHQTCLSQGEKHRLALNPTIIICTRHQENSCVLLITVPQLVLFFQNLKRSSQKINYQTNWQRHISHWSLSAMVSRLNRLKCTFPERREQNVYDESISCLFRRQNVKRWPFIKKRIFLCWNLVWTECKSLHWKEAI